MTTHRHPVVVGVDGSPAAFAALRHAAARAARVGVPLHILHAYEFPLGVPTGVTEEESMLEALRTHGRTLLAEAEKVAVEAEPGLAVESELAAMPVTTGLLNATADASALVLGNRGHNPLAGLLVGSTVLALAGRATCPVLLVRDGPDGDGEDRPVVVGVDGTAAGDEAIGFAFAEAARLDAPLIAVHAWAESVFETALAGDYA